MIDAAKKCFANPQSFFVPSSSSFFGAAAHSYSLLLSSARRLQTMNLAWAFPALQPVSIVACVVVCEAGGEGPLFTGLILAAARQSHETERSDKRVWNHRRRKEKLLGNSWTMDYPSLSFFLSFSHSPYTLGPVCRCIIMACRSSNWVKYKSISVDTSVRVSQSRKSNHPPISLLITRFQF